MISKKTYAIMAITVAAMIAVSAISYGVPTDMTKAILAVVAGPVSHIFNGDTADKVSETTTTTTTSVIPEPIATKNNAFAIDFYRELSKNIDNNDSNIFFSPASMYAAFSMLYEGAKENTAKEIQQTINIEPNGVARHNDMRYTISSINREDPHATMLMANALWLAPEFEPYSSFRNRALHTYQAEINTVSFVKPEQEPDAIKQINDWAAHNTNNRIPEVITKDGVNESTAMIITNAIYFKGTWQTQFDVQDTVESDFATSKSKKVKAGFMTNEHGIFPYTKSSGAQVLKMPYDGERLSMLIILPRHIHEIHTLEESLTPEMIEQWRQNLSDIPVTVKMPKFQMKTHYDLVPQLTELGITDLFDGKAANLSGIADVEHTNLYVSRATQDAFVQVNEEGTEAAAVTSNSLSMTKAAPAPPQFIADHPFIFLIQDDESGAILFMGRVSDPSS